MRISNIEDEKANALGRQIMETLDELPSFSDEALEQYGDRRIWEEMRTAGFIRSEEKYRSLISHIGPTLRDLYKDDDGRNPEVPTEQRVQGKLLRSGAGGRRLVVEVGNFIRLNYGFDPEWSADERWSFGDGDSNLDVSNLDEALTASLQHKIDFSEIKLSPSALKIIENTQLQTVGDFVVLSSTYLKNELGLTSIAISRVSKYIKEKCDFSLEDIRGQSVVSEALKWKYAVLNAQGRVD